MPIALLVADDHPLVVAALRAAFERDGHIRIVGETQHGADVPRLVEELRPDVLLLDLTMPDVDGFEVLRRLAEAEVRVRVVVLSMHTTTSYASRAVKLGALGYVGKNAPATELVRAIDSAATGQRYLAPPLCEHALREYELRVAGDHLDPFETLSNREREVMRHTALGGTNRSIAEALGISKRTVETHVASVMHKLGVESRAELVRHAVRVGLIK